MKSRHQVGFNATELEKAVILPVYFGSTCKPMMSKAKRLMVLG